jgi:hypothetical protein
MEWRFWRWGKQRKNDETERARLGKQAAKETAWLPKPYSHRQILALQRTVGNQAVLRWLGLHK